MALVRVNEQGRRIGESHRNARHSDEDVERAIAAYEVLRSYAKVAAAVGAKKSTVRDWIKGNRRGQVGPRTSERDPLVNAHYRMPLSRRRKVLERGGAKWVNALIDLRDKLDRGDVWASDYQALLGLVEGIAA